MWVLNEVLHKHSCFCHFVKAAENIDVPSRLMSLLVQPAVAAGSFGDTPLFQPLDR